MLKTLPLRRIRASNFQILKSIDVSLGRITVFQGDSDVGKSAIIRLILASMTGDNLKGAQRVGSKGCEIYLEGAKAAVRYDGKKHYLSLRGKEEKVESRKVAMAALGLPVVEAAKDLEYAPNVTAPLQPPFLILERPAAAARILGSFTAVGVTLTALREANRLIKNLQAERGTNTRRQEELKDTLKTQYGDTAARKALALELEEDTEEVTRLGRRYQELKEARGEFEAAWEASEVAVKASEGPAKLRAALPDNLKELEAMFGVAGDLKLHRGLVEKARYDFGFAVGEAEQAEKRLKEAEGALAQMPMEAGDPCPFSRVALPAECVTNLKEKP